MNVLPMNDREKIILEDSQIGFIRFVALGLFEIVKDSMEGKSTYKKNQGSFIHILLF
jgi:hypothetical protein